jgi:hypothetical protein
MEKRQNQEEIQGLKKMLLSREDFSETANTFLVIKQLKDDLKRSRINEAQLKIRLAQISTNG